MKYSISSLFILTAIIGLLFSCKSDSKSTVQNQPADIKVSSDPYVANTQKLLQGTWINLDEKGVTVIYKGNTRVENVVGKPEGKTRYYEVANECKNDAAGDARVVKAKAKYISMQDIDLCYYIVKLNKTHMHLKTVGRGNVIRYKRKGAVNKRRSNTLDLKNSDEEK